MPLGPGIRYRYRKGTSTRLAFRGKNVIEAKNMETGATHSPAEFAAERRRKPKAARASVAGYRGR